jgi:hypothetical protein
MAQLAAAERLAYYHEGKAMVRELPDGAAEIVLEKSGRLFRHRIDEMGALIELPGSGRTALYLAGTAIAVVGMLGFLGIFVVFGFVTGGFAAVVGTLVMMSLIPLGATLRQKDGLERRVPRSEPGT